MEWDKMRTDRNRVSSTQCRSLLQRCLPIDYNCNRRGLTRRRAVDQKLLAIRSEVPAVHLNVGASAVYRYRSREQRLGSAGLERRAECHIDTHQLALAVEIQ